MVVYCIVHHVAVTGLAHRSVERKLLVVKPSINPFKYNSAPELSHWRTETRLDRRDRHELRRY